MSECCENPAHICEFPTELLIYIFKFLPARDFTKCRRVCKRWKEVIDDISGDDHLWEKYCLRDFEDISMDAKKKSTSCRLWFDVYRSLSLWSKLSEASEFTDEFCHSSIFSDEIRDLTVHSNGVLAVHKRMGIVYYDISTLDYIDRDPIYGDYTRFVQMDNITITLDCHLHLRIFRRLRYQIDDPNIHEIQREQESVFHNTKFFLVLNKDVYFITFINQIFHCNLDGELEARQLRWPYSDIASNLSFCNGYLNVLTIERGVYAYKDNEFVKLFVLDSQPNLFDCLWRYKFFHNIDWRMIFIWVSQMKIVIPEGPLRHICFMKQYGDVFLVGCCSGMVRIYYKPFTNGELDLINNPPVKHYNFFERIDIPILSLHPILALEVIEIKGGHKLLVVMPKKIIVVTYIHNFEIVTSKAVIPYEPPGPLALMQ